MNAAIASVRPSTAQTVSAELDVKAVAAELCTVLAHIESLTPNHPDP